MHFKIDYPKQRNWAKEYGLNAIYAGKHWSKRRQDSEFWHTLTWAALARQQVPRRVLTKPVCITFWWHDKLDLDNHAYMGKMIVDALKGWLLVDDDKRYFVELVHKFHSEPWIGVAVEEVDE